MTDRDACLAVLIKVTDVLTEPADHPGLRVSDKTLREVGYQIADLRQIGQAGLDWTMLHQALDEMRNCEDAGDGDRAARFRWIAKMLVPLLRSDLAEPKA